ncbi:MAG TPA: sigma-70 family RNA polymerase sigma factor [Dehalococcoidia bacterium]|jgi:RNA polymerase sigma-70 factor (ECF subfamily)|nr:sigma-70 family RNA polymerase sigma factor [Dehalococcoidia bacterium]
MSVIPLLLSRFPFLLSNRREPSGCLRSNLSERSPLEDETLIAAAQQGDAAAFEELVLRYQEAAFRTAFLVLRDADEAKDAAQEGFVKAYKAIRTFRRGHEFRPWLLRIVVNQSLTMLRSRRRGSAATERLALREQPLPHTLDETVIDRERARLVWAALQSLREQERVVVYLRYFLNLPERELAEYLGCAQGTVKSRLHRALSKLRDVVTHRYPELLGDAN